MILDFSYNDWINSKLNHHDISEQEIALHFIEETTIGLYMKESSCPKHFEDYILQSGMQKYNQYSRSGQYQI